MAIILKGSKTAQINPDYLLEPKQPGVELLDNGYSRLKIGNTDASGNKMKWSELPYVTPLTSVYKDDCVEFEGEKVLRISTDHTDNVDQIESPGMYGTIHIGQSAGYNIALNADSEIRLASTNVYSGNLYPFGANNETLGSSSRVWTNTYSKEFTSGDMSIKYNSATETLEFISL